ncbi:uncharacterized serine/threonine-protein kinase SBK3 [Lepidochelys kempii]|uniref:uncharacterized serine/threonine-protein kinase SBK3 n=1 Tax=Lepidochelys kempii TaxID=8472 RepID=UPI003C6FCA3E
MELPEVEDNAEFLERLMEVTSRRLPQLELQEQYTIIKELGRGTYGNVLLAEHREQGTALALKLMPKERTERRAFLREYCIALCLSAHAGFLRTLPIVFESPTHFAFAQELAPAGDLCAIVHDGEGLPEAQVKRCAAQLAEALDFMHGKALVHRDIKLDNVLLFDCECRRVKLGDFGLTRLEGTPVCAMSGTLPYAPPELCLLEASETLELDASLDVWAFGVLLFCLGTGCFPWDVAVSPDPQFEEFGAWQNSTVPGEVPAPWRAFSSAAQEMFRRLLTLDPNRRSPAIEVHKYLPLVWLASSLRELDGPLLAPQLSLNVSLAHVRDTVTSYWPPGGQSGDGLGSQREEDERELGLQEECWQGQGLGILSATAHAKGPAMSLAIWATLCTLVLLLLVSAPLITFMLEACPSLRGLEETPRGRSSTMGTRGLGMGEPH